MRTAKSIGDPSDVFTLLAYGLVEGFIDVDSADQEVKDDLVRGSEIQNRVLGNVGVTHWASFAYRLRKSSKKKETSDGPIERIVRRIFETYSLLRFEDNSLGLGRGDLRAGDRMIHTWGAGWAERKTHTRGTGYMSHNPTFLIRPVVDISSSLIGVSSASDMSYSQSLRRDEEWRIVGTAFVYAPLRQASPAAQIMKGVMR